MDSWGEGRFCVHRRWIAEENVVNKEVDSCYISLISIDFSILCRRFESGDNLKIMYSKRKLAPFSRGWKCRSLWRQKAWSSEMLQKVAGAKAPGELEPQVHQPLSRLRDVIHASSYFSLLSCWLLVILHITSCKNFPQKPQSKLSSSVLFFHHTVHLFLNLRALSTVANYTFFPMLVCLLLVSPIIKLKATQEQEACLVLLMLVFLALSLMSGTY